ncbi:MAG: o-succinylbenzoate synthase [Oceanipulchritudo sp.]
MSNLEIRARRYRRPFTRPLRTALGEWRVREGIVLRVADPETNRVGFGEIAPLPDNQDSRLPSTDVVASRSFLSSPADPCVSFAISSALARLEEAEISPSPVRTAALLGLGPGTASEISSRRAEGHRTFKLKVGLADPESEWGFLQAVTGSLKAGEQLRLDPNRSWDPAAWEFWKPRLGEMDGWIEFVEEPFAGPEARERMIAEGAIAPVPLALDESLVAGSLEFWLKHAWPGYFVVKPSLTGNPANWLDPLGNRANRVVLSSAFETGIGISAVLRLAQAFPGTDHGLGTQSYFEDNWGVPRSGAVITALSTKQEEQLWNRLPAD